jgi:uncharacterized membrane protein YdjX (TVP38/TMEM64 family)
MTPLAEKQKWILGAIAGAGLLILGFALRHPLVSWMEGTMTMLRSAGPVPFFLAMALLPAAGFPLAAFTVIAGPVFGPTLGVSAVIACTILAVTVNVALSYWIATYALRPLIEKILLRFRYRVPRLPAHSAWAWILLVRIVPGPPFFLQSYLLALARAPFATYMLVSTLVPACYLTATILLGDGLVRHEPRAIVSAVVIFIVAGTAVHVLRKRLSRSQDVPR